MVLMHDLYDRRLQVDRRQFSYSYCIPERRTDGVQRNGIERRNFLLRSRWVKANAGKRVSNDQETEAA
jgi:hypothetical protein